MRSSPKAGIDVKIEALGFVAQTSTSFTELRQLGLAAAEHAGGAITRVAETEVEQGKLILYMVKRLGFLQVMTFGLVFTDSEDGTANLVILQPGSDLTSQATLMFIPVGPNSAVGYEPLRSFSTYSRAGLAAPRAAQREHDPTNEMQSASSGAFSVTVTSAEHTPERAIERTKLFCTARGSTNLGDRFCTQCGAAIRVS